MIMNRIGQVSSSTMREKRPRESRKPLEEEDKLIQESLDMEEV
jgi:hypothetical protein